MNYLQATANRIGEELGADATPPDANRLLLIYAILAHAKGAATTAEDVHNAWTAWMLMRGEEHQSMRPFDELSRDVQRADEPFLRAIRTVAAQL